VDVRRPGIRPLDREFHRFIASAADAALICPTGKKSRQFRRLAPARPPHWKLHARKSEFTQAIQPDLGGPVSCAKTIRFLFSSIDGFLSAIPAR
jgi:hypothetical protein